MAGGLFGADLPDGFRYAAAFVSVEEERRLTEVIAGIEFANFEMRGVVARRRVAFFGHSYDRAAAGLRGRFPRSCCRSAPGSPPGPA